MLWKPPFTFSSVMSICPVMTLLLWATFAPLWHSYTLLGGCSSLLTVVEEKLKAMYWLRQGEVPKYAQLTGKWLTSPSPPIDQWEFSSRTWFVSQKCLLPQDWLTSVLRIKNKRTHRHRKKDLPSFQVNTWQLASMWGQERPQNLQCSTVPRCAHETRGWDQLRAVGCAELRQTPASPTSRWSSSSRSVELRLFLLRLSAIF